MKYDAIIIGTGQAGPPLAGKLAGNGMKTAIVEKGAYGGTCVNVGCTPTKAYVASARRAYAARSSSELGVSAANVQVDLKKIKARKDALVEESRDGLREYLHGLDDLTIYNGKARFTGPHTVAVAGQELQADRIFINVGARPRIPDGFDKIDYLTNRSILELEDIPGHLVVVGGGYVGLEFGQMFRRFGSEVTIVERSGRLLSQEDEDISKAIANVMKAEGITLRLNAECISGSQQEDGRITVDLDCEDDPRRVTGSHLLLAAGRVPATDDLGLSAAGIAADDHGYIEVNKHLQTNVSGIFALGDCNGEGAFTHTAYNDYQIASSFLFGDGSRTLSDRFVSYAAYIDPPVARVGLNEQQVKDQGLDARMARYPMDRVARAREKAETHGLMKIIVDADNDRILGASFVGTGADEYIHAVIDLMFADAPYTVIRDAVHIHPTVSELIPTMLQELEPVE